MGQDLLEKEGTDLTEWKKPKHWDGMGNFIPAREAQVIERNKSQVHTWAQPGSRAGGLSLPCLAQVVLSPSFCFL